MCHANKWEHMTNNDERSQATETGSEITQMIDLEVTKRTLTFSSAWINLKQAYSWLHALDFHFFRVFTLEKQTCKFFLLHFEV